VTPDRIGDRYQLSAPLGHGAMGEVWEGYDQRLDRRVAVKFVRRSALPGNVDYDTLVKRFLREARVSARLEHPGVPTVYDAGVHEGEAYLTMQLVTGHTLAELVAERGPLPVSWAAAVGAQISSVLAAAHAGSLVHRDLKPRNVMVCPDGAVKVLDFGIAVMLGSLEPSTRLTTTGQVLGTPAYMAPEQAGGGDIGPPADLYALGCVLHALLAGTPPFVADSPLAVVGQHLYADPAPLRSLRPDVPPPVERLVLRLLAKEPAGRPAGAAEVYHALVQYVGSAGTGAELGPTRPFHYPLGPLPALPSPAEPPPTGSPAVASGDAAVRSLDQQRERAVSLVDEGRITQAGQVLADAARVAGGALGTDHPEVVDARLALAHVYLLGGDHRRALPELQRLVRDLSTHYGADHDFVWDAKRGIAGCYAALGEHARAVGALRTLLAERERVRGPGDPAAGELRSMLARLGG
jgi:serine/threonine protein kinase